MQKCGIAQRTPCPIELHPLQQQQQRQGARPTSAASSSLQFDHIEMDHVANYGGEKGELDMVDRGRRNTTATVEEEGRSLDNTQQTEEL